MEIEGSSKTISKLTTVSCKSPISFYPPMLKTNWPPPPTHIPIPNKSVDVWLAELEQSEKIRAQLWPLLNAEEQKRALRFHFDIHRHHFIVGRGLLRILLGNYLHIPPAEIAFAYGAYGKPFLPHTPLQFNISHAHGVALLAITQGRTLGVDVEEIRPLADAALIAKMNFSAREVAQYTAVPDAQKPLAFYNCWTRKEAFIKAIGEGLTCPLDSFDVTLIPQEPAQLLQIRGSQTEAEKWRLQSLTPVDGYVGAIIATGQDWQLNCWQWPNFEPI